MTGRARLVLVVSLLAVLAAPALATPAHAQDAPPERVIIFSLPRTSWEDVQEAEMPVLEAFLRDAAIANMSVRAASSRTSLADGYATIGAGTRADGGTLGPAAFTRNEEVDNSTACGTYERRTGRECDGAVLHLGIANAVATNENLRGYGAKVGLLGTSLEAAGHATGVIGNADGPALSSATRLTVAESPAPEAQAEDPTSEQAEPPELLLGRSLALGAMNEHGTVDSGTVSEALLANDSAWPYGVRLDPSTVTGRVEGLLADPALKLIVVEASDLERADRAAPLAVPEQRVVLRNQALAAADHQLGELLKIAPLETTRYIVVAPASRASRSELTVFATAGPGVEAGTAVSPSTRRAGYVTLPDVGPTVLDALDVERPDAMTGRPITSTGEATDVAHHVAANEEVLARDALVTPIVVVFIAVLALLFLVASIYLWRRQRSPVFAFLGIWGACVPAAMFLARPLPFEAWSVAAAIGVVFAIAGVVAMAAWATRRWWEVGPVLLVAAVTFAVIAVDTATGTHLEMNSVLGYSPVVAGRFAGIGNLGWALLAASGVLCATLIVVRWGRGAVPLGIATAILAAVVVIAGAPMWGSDIGGIIGGAPAMIVAWFLIAGRRPRLRTIALCAGGVLFVLAAATILDLTRAADQQTHLARFVTSIADDGPGVFTTVVGRKLQANLSILQSSIFVLFVPVTVAFLIALGYQRVALRSVLERYPPLTGGLAGVIVAGIFGSLLNDSGIAILAIMLAFVAPLLLALRSDVGVVEAEPSDVLPAPTGGGEDGVDAPVQPRGRAAEVAGSAP